MEYFILLAKKANLPLSLDDFHELIPVLVVLLIIVATYLLLPRMNR